LLFTATATFRFLFSLYRATTNHIATAQATARQHRSQRKSYADNNGECSVKGGMAEHAEIVETSKNSFKSNEGSKLRLKRTKSISGGFIPTTELVL
jgi:hypothetical protein